MVCATLTTIQKQTSKLDLHECFYPLKAVNKAWLGEAAWLLPSRADNKLSGVLEYQEPVNAIDRWIRSQIRLPLGLLFLLHGCFFRGSLVGRPTARSHAALRQDDDSQE